MDASKSQLFSDRLAERFKASIAASAQEREEVIDSVMLGARLGEGRLGTSGAANAYLLFVSNEFGTAPPNWTAGDIDEAGWKDLWRLRVGERNPHFSPERSRFRNNRRLWINLYEQLPKAFGETERAYAMCAWSNLAESRGTPSAISDGMTPVAQLIHESGTRVVAAVKKEVWPIVKRWAKQQGGSDLVVDDMVDAQIVTVNSRTVVAAYLGGHPSHWNQYMSSADFVRRIRALIEVSESASR